MRLPVLIWKILRELPCRCRRVFPPQLWRWQEAWYKHIGWRWGRRKCCCRQEMTRHNCLPHTNDLCRRISPSHAMNLHLMGGLGWGLHDGAALQRLHHGYPNKLVCGVRWWPHSNCQICLYFFIHCVANSVLKQESDWHPCISVISPSCSFRLDLPTSSQLSLFILLFTRMHSGICACHW